MINLLLETSTEGTLKPAAEAFSNMIKSVLPILLPAAAALILVWALYCGIKFVVAKSQEQQKEAKQQIRNFVIGVIAIFVLAVGITALVYFLKDWSSEAMEGITKNSISMLFPVSSRF